MLSIELNRRQYNALEGLSHWISENRKAIESGETSGELEKIHNTIISVMDELDRLKVPFWVQNCAIAYADSWRNTKTHYFMDEMRKKGITLHENN